MQAASSAPSLSRVVGVPGAVLMGLGSILGTGIFVSIGLAAAVAGSATVLAVAAAAVVATCNGLSSAQLAASHPVSGGTYEYGYRYLSPWLGFTAGWMFVCAKSASAATAALGFAGYVLASVNANGAVPRGILALGAVGVLTLLVRGGMHRSNRANAWIVGTTLVTLLLFVLAGVGPAWENASTHLETGLGNGGFDTSAFLQATALMFVAYTGYGRIATLGEEIRSPSRNIPRAIIITLVVSMVLYVTVTAVAVAAVGAPGFASATHTAAAPLALVARAFAVPGVAEIVSIGAIAAMLGVLLNLVLGVSRVVLAMARRRDLPGGLAHVDGRTASPTHAVVFTGVVIGSLALSGSVQTTWSFSAFTVLVYYAITNLAALQLPPEQRRFPRGISILGLVSCAGLAFFVETEIWLVGLGLIALGLGWHHLARHQLR